MVLMLVVMTAVVGLFLITTGMTLVVRHILSGVALITLGALLCLNVMAHFIQPNQINEKEIKSCLDSGGWADIYGRSGEYIYCHHESRT